MNLKKAVKISRSIVWIIFPVVILIGLKLSGAQLSLISLIQILSFTFPFNFYLYGINDVHDIETDKINPRKNSEIHGAKINKNDIKPIKKISLICILIIFLASLLTRNTQNILLTSLLVLIAYIYSAKIRLKEIPVLDSITNGLGYVYLPAAIGFSYGSSIINLPFKAYFVVLCAIAIHAFSTAVDYSSDKQAKQRTFAAFFGKRITILFSSTIILITILFANIKSLIINICLYYCLILFIISLIKPKEKILRIIFLLIFYGFLATIIIYLPNLLSL